jgi:prepilin-type N-terminal cleavage/methylation domain-containing protein
MNLQNIKKLRAERGFTIVELLIVIVVIGILAAIVIVAYNGIQDRAKNTKYQTDAQALIKGAEAINADKGNYPYGTDDATLRDATTGWASSSAFKIPQGENILYVATTSPPDYATALAGADTSPTRLYYVDPCTPNGAGVKVYYPVRGGAGSVATITAGDAGAGC